MDSCFCLSQTAIWIYLIFLALNNMTQMYYVSCSLQGVWVFEHTGNRQELISDIMYDIDRCHTWRDNVANNWVQADFNSTHRLCTVDFKDRESAFSTLQEKCHLGVDYLDDTNLASSGGANGVVDGSNSSMGWSFWNWF